jgi:SAM-dependent methyltransferase
VLRNFALSFAFEGMAVSDPGPDVSELGPGPGLTTDLLGTELRSLTVLELDPHLAAELGSRLGTVVTVVEGDATHMPFVDSRFSGVASLTVLHHLPTSEAQDLFTEVRRVLRPGGLFVANDKMASDELAGLHVGDVCNPVEPETLPARLADAGFADVQIAVNDDAFALRARTPFPTATPAAGGHLP